MRRKYTSDSIYLYVKSAKYGNSSKNYYSVSTENNGSGADTNHGTTSYRKLAVGTEYLLYNWVYETADGKYYPDNLKTDQSRYNIKYAQCNLEFRALCSGNSESNIYGYWSPDSVATSGTVSTYGQSIGFNSYPN